MKIVIVTDAWEPQVNGVVNTLGQTRKHLQLIGHQVVMLTPEKFKRVPCPSYSSIELAVLPYKKVAQFLRNANPDAIHIATEGPLGFAARRWCLRHKRAFTTSYHTQFPEYLRLRFPIPEWLTYAWLKSFHRPASSTLVPTKSQQQRLQRKGFAHVAVWGRGVDTDIFHPDSSLDLDLPRPIYINVGRVSVEKNLHAFLALDLPGSKVIIGEGPDFDTLRAAYPDAHFLGPKYGADLAAHLAAADVFVFPSRTDTFGLVLLEAMACGLPIAAYPVTGPIDIIQAGTTGILDDNLAHAVHAALQLDRSACVNYAQQHSWAKCTATFANYLVASINRDNNSLLNSGRATYVI